MLFYFDSNLARAQEDLQKVPALSTPSDLPGILCSHLPSGKVTSLDSANRAPCGAI